LWPVSWSGLTCLGWLALVGGSVSSRRWVPRCRPNGMCVCRCIYVCTCTLVLLFCHSRDKHDSRSILAKNSIIITQTKRPFHQTLDPARRSRWIAQPRRNRTTWRYGEMRGSRKCRHGRLICSCHSPTRVCSTAPTRPAESSAFLNSMTSPPASPE